MRRSAFFQVHLLQKRIAAMVESKVRIFTKLSAAAFHEEGTCNLGLDDYRWARNSELVISCVESCINITSFSEY